MNYIKYILLTMVIISCTVTSCTKDHRELITPQNEVYGAALPVISDQVGSIFDLLDLDNSKVSFTVAGEGEATVNGVTLKKRLNGGAEADHATVSGSSANFEITAADAVQGLGIGTGDLKIGDVFEFLVLLNTDKGTFRSNRNIAVRVSCSSDIGGNYGAVTSGVSTDGCCLDPVENFAGSVTLANNGGGEYTLSDYSGGLYLEWYGVYGITADTDVTVTLVDVCNELSFAGGSTEAFGATLSAAGARSPDTGIITLECTNGWGDTWSMTLTPE